MVFINLLALFFMGLIGADSSIVEDLVLFKCCKAGQVLVEGGRVCKAGGELNWAPIVYSPENQSFFQPGTTPAHWRWEASDPPACTRPRLYPTWAGNPSYVLTDNGSLHLLSGGDDSTDHLFQPREYCVDATGALVCDGTEEPAGPRVHKCCGRRAQYSEKKSSCVTAEKDHDRFELLKLAWGFPSCPEDGSFAIGGTLNSSYRLLDNGSLESSSTGVLLSGNEFCLERIEGRPADEVHVITCLGRLAGHQEHDLRFTLYPVGLFISVFFLGVTLIASCLLPSTYHVLHWRCQINHVGCLLVGELLLAITQVSGRALSEGIVCKGIAIVMHFMFLAAFFWLNTMCFNIWWTFRDLRPASLDKGQEACRLIVYEVYAWGGPLLIAGIAALLDNLPTDSKSNFVRPKFGTTSCWFTGDTELLAYFFGPIGVLLLLNLTLFAATARELTCGLWKTEVVKSNTERATLGRVCLKLVVVMGVTWVSDVVSWAVGGPNYLWYVPDLINALQGVMIFCVVGCQPQVWAAVKRLWCLGESPSEGTNPRSSSSHALPSLGDQNTTMTKVVESLC